MRSAIPSDWFAADEDRFVDLIFPATDVTGERTGVEMRNSPPPSLGRLGTKA